MQNILEASDASILFELMQSGMNALVDGDIERAKATKNLLDMVWLSYVNVVLVSQLNLADRGASK